MNSSLQPSLVFTMENSNTLEFAVNARKFKIDVLKRMIILSLILQKISASYQGMMDEDFDDDEEDEFDDEFGDEFDDELDDEIIDDDDDDDFDEDYDDDDDDEEEDF